MQFSVLLSIDGNSGPAATPLRKYLYYDVSPQYVIDCAFVGSHIVFWTRTEPVEFGLSRKPVISLFRLFGSFGLHIGVWGQVSKTHNFQDLLRTLLAFCRIAKYPGFPRPYQETVVLLQYFLESVQDDGRRGRA